VRATLLAAAVALALVAHGATRATSYGLEWPGTGTVRRMLYWNHPFPIYDATYVFQVYPRAKQPAGDGKTYPNGYYTTFFWGNDGPFAWDGGVANTYYGAHPYPVPPPNGKGQWEISIASIDAVSGSNVRLDRWYTQAFRAWRESPTVTHHEFYYDLPDTTKVIRVTIDSTHWATSDPPFPAIMIGQAPDVNGASWGGYVGWEEFNGIIRGIQIYSGLLSLQEIQAEIGSPQSTATGQAKIWYLNLDPRPTDVSDKKIGGVPHDPAWDGTTALEWSQSVAADTDGDGVGGTADCAPNDPTAFAIPPEVEGLWFSSDKVTLSWDSVSAQSGSGARYDVVRGSIDQLPVGAGVDETCLALQRNPTTIVDAAVPTSGRGFYYLVRATNVCGTGSYGSSSTSVCGP
jgi:hypothetical protein